MRILGVDTSTWTASTAIVDREQIVAEDLYPRERNAGRSGPKANHSEIILPLVDSVLKRAGIGLLDVAGIAISVGPGSFTGIRIGLSTVKGLVYGTDIPAVEFRHCKPLPRALAISMELSVLFSMPEKMRPTQLYFINAKITSNV